MKSAEVAAPEDRRLVEAFLRERSEAAFRALYRRHTPRLYQMVLRLAGWREEDAAEILQDTWVRATRGLTEFRWESSLGTWLVGIAVNRSREVRRARTADSLPIVVERGHSVEIRPGPEVKIDMERAVASLPEGYRRVLILHDIEGFTHPEIGRFLGIEAGTSKSQLFEARRALRRQLGHRGVP